MTLEDGTQVRQFDSEQEFVDYLNVYEPLYTDWLEYQVIDITAENTLTSTAYSADVLSYATVPKIFLVNTYSLREGDNRYAIVNGVLWYQVAMPIASGEEETPEDWPSDSLWPECRLIYPAQLI